MNQEPIFIGSIHETGQEVIDRFAAEFWDRPRKARWDADHKTFRMINGNQQYRLEIWSKVWCIFPVNP